MRNLIHLIGRKCYLDESVKVIFAMMGSMEDKGYVDGDKMFIFQVSVEINPVTGMQ